MTPEKIDYLAILNDMKAKRAMLDASISALEAALTSGIFGQAVEGLTSTNSGHGSPVGTSGPVDLPTGAFLGKNMTDAVILYLSAARQRKTVKDIAAALLGGGIVSTSGNFTGVVQAKMQQLGARGQVLKFADGWGLAEWYPAGYRSTAEKVTKPPQKPKRRKVASKAANRKDKVQSDSEPKTDEHSEKSGAQATIEAFFATNIREFSSGEIAKELGLSTGAVNLVCAKLAHQGKVDKTPMGRYKPKVHAMPKAV